MTSRIQRKLQKQLQDIDNCRIEHVARAICISENPAESVDYIDQWWRSYSDCAEAAIKAGRSFDRSLTKPAPQEKD